MSDEFFKELIKLDKTPPQAPVSEWGSIQAKISSQERWRVFGIPAFASLAVLLCIVTLNTMNQSSNNEIDEILAELYQEQEAYFLDLD